MAGEHTMNTELDLLNGTPASTNVLVAYNGKVVDMGYATPDQPPSKRRTDEQFKRGCQRVNDNIPNGGKGYVRTPSGKTYEISRDSKAAKLVQP
jgi:hypothetical protein